MNDQLKTKEELLKELQNLQHEFKSLKTSHDKEIRERNDNELKLTKAMESAMESDRMKTAFLSNISHEMRTPMNAIIGFLQLLNGEDVPGYPKEEIVKIITESSNQLLFLINDIVDFAKIESSSTKPHLNPANVLVIATKAFEMFKLAAAKKGLTYNMKINLPENKLNIVTDEPKLRQTLINLLSNAIKFTDSGSVHLHCSFNNGNEKELLFFVKDTGIGIESEGHVKVFERFKQSDKLDVAKYGGTGLGLSISKAFIEMLGGKIWIESILGKGCTFYFTVPFKSEIKQAPKKPAIELMAARENYNWKGKTIMIAEDSETSYQLYVAVFEKTGVNFIRANDGQEAIDKLMEHPEIELILMDIRMPVMDGYEATRHIRQFNKNIPIIAQTAYAEEEDREKAIAAGCNDYQLKPVNIAFLFKTIDMFMNKK